MSSTEESRTSLEQDAEIIRHFYGWAKHKHGAVYNGCVPGTYLAFDVETTGTKRGEDLITMIGFCAVERGEPVFYEGKFLNWYEYDKKVITDSWLDKKLMDLSWKMGDKWHGISPETLREKGEPPLDVLEYMLAVFEEYREKGAVFAAHNMLRTDAPLVQLTLAEFIGAEWIFYDDEVLDTAAVEKAAAIGVLPDPAETVTGYFKRVLGIRSTAKYNMDLCVSKYAMDESYDFDLNERHQADFDALLVHYLIEEHRALVGC